VANGSLIWLGALATVAGSVIVILADLVSLVTLPAGVPLSVAAAGGAWRPILALYLIAALLLLVGLPGLHVRQAAAAGWFGIVGLVAAAAGTSLVAGLNWFNVVAAPELAVAAPAALDAVGEGPLVLGAGAAFAAGLFLFGAATLRAGVFPRPGAALLTVGALVLLLPLPLANLASGAGALWLALAALRDRAKTRFNVEGSRSSARPAGSTAAPA
jgi:hypothetical protein